MRASLAPAPWWLGALGASLVAGCVAVLTSDTLRQSYVTWDTASSAWHEVLWATGSLVAGASALFGALVIGRHTRLHEARARGGHVQLVTACAALWAWSLLGLVIGMAPLTLAAARTATWGHLDLRDVTIAALGLLLHVTLGLAIGVALSHWLAGLAAAAVAYLVGSLPIIGALRPIAMLQPVQQWPTSPQFVLSTATTAFSAIALAVGATAVVCLGSWALVRHGPAAGTALAVTAAWVVLIGTAFVWRPDFYTPRRDVHLVCDDARPAVCVHPAHEGSREALRTLTARIDVASPGLLQGRVIDNDSWPEDRRPGDALVSVMFPSTDPRNLYQSQDEVLAADLTEQLLLAPCTGAVSPKWADAHSVRGELLRRLGYADLAARVSQDSESSTPLAALSDGELSGLLSHTARSLRTCSGLTR